MVLCVNITKEIDYLFKVEELHVIIKLHGIIERY